MGLGAAREVAGMGGDVGIHRHHSGGMFPSAAAREPGRVHRGGRLQHARDGRRVLVEGRATRVAMGRGLEMKKRLLHWLAALALFAGALPAFAAYPEKPIRLIVPSAAGGAP